MDNDIVALILLATIFGSVWVKFAISTLISRIRYEIRRRV